MVIVPQQRQKMKGEPTLKERYEDVRGRIADAAARSGRRPDDIVLAAVTKFASIDQVRELIELGHTDFAENRVQALVQRAGQIDEFLQRHRQLHSSRHVNLPRQLRWHMIGHLQRNKVRKVLELVRLIHSVDSLRLAEEIQVAAAKREEPMEVLVQVNVSGEKTKYGVAPAAAGHLVEQIDTMMSIRPRGLMCMAPLVEDPEEVRPVFERCRELAEDIRSHGLGGDQFDILSMGMTNDFEVAIECGANVVRVGSAIFGPPADPDQADAGGGQVGDG
jgi:pyridoxal phosphate enzyme (YggS family)